MIDQIQDARFNAVEHDRYGEPAKVLRLVRRSAASLRPGPDEIVVHVTKRPIHPGDLHMIRAATNGGPADPIDPSAPRTPGVEGVGSIEQLGANLRGGDGKLAVGQRVAFFAAGAWATRAVVPSSAVVPLPGDISDDVAAMMLVNTLTALVVLRTGHASLPVHVRPPVFVLQSAAGAAVGRLFSRIAMDRGVKPIRLVRSKASAQSLLAVLPGAPVIMTQDHDWKDQVRDVLAGAPLHAAVDSVGGAFIDEIASLLEPGGTIVNFGWLGDGAPDLSSFAPNSLSLRGATVGSWHGETSEDQRAADLQTAVELAHTAPELFEVAAKYPLSEFQAAIAHVSRPSRSGTVLLTS